MKKVGYGCLALLMSFSVYAGGNPDQVSFPEAYKSEFTQYDVRNRAGKPQVAVMYANKIAMESAKNGKLADGSVVVMEVHKAKVSYGEPIEGKNGIYQKGKFAAVAVMEKRSDWDGKIDANDRAGNWGFAIYNTDGTPKENNLECAACHTPMPENDYMFSFPKLVEVAGN